MRMALSAKLEGFPPLSCSCRPCVDSWKADVPVEEFDWACPNKYEQLSKIWWGAKQNSTIKSKEDTAAQLSGFCIFTRKSAESETGKKVQGASRLGTFFWCKVPSGMENDMVNSRKRYLASKVAICSLLFCGPTLSSRWCLVWEPKWQLFCWALPRPSCGRNSGLQKRKRPQR